VGSPPPLLSCCACDPSTLHALLSTALPLGCEIRYPFSPPSAQVLPVVHYASYLRRSSLGLTPISSRSSPRQLQSLDHLPPIDQSRELPKQWAAAKHRVLGFPPRTSRHQRPARLREKLSCFFNMQVLGLKRSFFLPLSINAAFTGPQPRHVRKSSRTSSPSESSHLF